MICDDAGVKPRLVVVSHACVIDVNQAIYVDLENEFEVTLVVPRTWRDDLRAANYPAQRLGRFHGTLCTVRTVGRGRVQRHFALVNATRLIKRARADFLIIEEEPFSLAALRWSRVANRLEVPFAVQVAENLDRELPKLIRRARTKVLAKTWFVLARSPAALARAQQWGFVGTQAVIGHGVEMTSTARGPRPGGVVGFVGRMVPAKGVTELAEALRAHPELRLRVVGDGPLREEFASLGDRVEMLGTVAPEEMDAFYRSVDVVAVPSRTTATWSEQFGRVLVEAQACATAVVAYNSGEIPWVASLTSVVLIPEGDVSALGQALSEVALDPARAQTLGEQGRLQVEQTFSNAVLAQQLAGLITHALASRK